MAARGARWPRGRPDGHVGDPMAEASSATTNRGDSAALVRIQFGLFTAQKMNRSRLTASWENCYLILSYSRDRRRRCIKQFDSRKFVTIQVFSPPAVASFVC